VSSTERPYRRLYRSKDKVICGVCGGVAEYLGTDPVLVRLIAVLAALVNLPAAALAYFVACIIVPEKEVAEGGTAGAAETPQRRPAETSRLVKLALGILLVLAGVALLLRPLREVLVELVDLLSRLGGLAPGAALLGLALVVAGAVLIALSIREGRQTQGSGGTSGPGS